MAQTTKQLELKLQKEIDEITKQAARRALERKELTQEYHWNPWHGCYKCSEGCLRCYMYEQDKTYGVNSSKIARTKTNFNMPIQRIRTVKSVRNHPNDYKISSGSVIYTCMTSDFFLEEADFWRKEAWEIIHERADCLFIIITKRVSRIAQCLPSNWLDGWNNVVITSSVETQERAEERIPILLQLPLKHRAICVAPMLEEIDLRHFLSSKLIEQVSVSGESWPAGKSRVLDYNWVTNLRQQCVDYDTTFTFFQTGSRLLKNNNIINILKRDEKGLAEFYNLDYKSPNNTYDWKLTAEQLNKRHTLEQAYGVYKQLKLEDFMKI